MKVISAICGSFSILTILPISRWIWVDKDDLVHSSSFFPLVGFFVGGLSIIPPLVLKDTFSMEICGLFYLISTILLTGGFHIDGLSDTFDGFSVKSTGERDEVIKKRLTVMSSGTQGPIGSLSVILVILLKFFFLRDLITHGHWVTFLILLPVFSRSSVVLGMYHGKSAKKEGLGSIFVGKIKKGHLFLSSFLTIFLIFICTLDLKFFVYLTAALFVLYLFTITITFLFQRRFGGHTGDTLGATNELAEVFFLGSSVIIQKFFV
ncbi:MAG: adenosylcobinamide-GDP ribazoletransferase [Deltaproteobacteria bacterium]|nr:adenosylcobinamide-GDP ribazoletransferase [Deltaproteobacteria bacterium]